MEIENYRHDRLDRFQKGKRIAFQDQEDRK
jgi:hypothetical protein